MFQRYLLLLVWDSRKRRATSAGSKNSLRDRRTMGIEDHFQRALELNTEPSSLKPEASGVFSFQKYDGIFFDNLKRPQPLKKDAKLSPYVQSRSHSNSNKIKNYTGDDSNSSEFKNHVSGHSREHSPQKSIYRYKPGVESAVPQEKDNRGPNTGCNMAERTNSDSENNCKHLAESLSHSASPEQNKRTGSMLTSAHQNQAREDTIETKKKQVYVSSQEEGFLPASV